MSNYDWSWYFDAPDRPWSNDRLMVEYYARDEEDIARTLARIRNARGLRIPLNRPPDDLGYLISYLQSKTLEQRGLVRILEQGNTAVVVIPR